MSARHQRQDVATIRQLEFVSRRRGEICIIHNATSATSSGVPEGSPFARMMYRQSASASRFAADSLWIRRRCISRADKGRGALITATKRIHELQSYAFLAIP